MSDKLYFFSIQKNGLALAVRKNYVERHSQEYEVLSSILAKCVGCKVAELTGQEIGVAKKAVAWAQSEGKSEYFHASYENQEKEREAGYRQAAAFNGKAAMLDRRQFRNKYGHY